jgi:ABC-type microcin C transport system duplicated ATPase subunit YejF
MSAAAEQIYATRTFTDPEVPMIELKGVSRRFVKKLDIAARLANKLGADVREEIVHAVDGVDLASARARSSAWSASPAAASRRSAASWPASIPQSGQIFWNGQDVAGLQGDAARTAKLRRQMIFQDPYASLNPRMRWPTSWARPRRSMA